jgi:hypothetical protein
MSDGAVPTLSGPSRATVSASPLHVTPSESSHELNGATSGVSQGSAVTASTQLSSETSALVNRQATLSRTSTTGSPIEIALTGEQHNGETQEDSPWARKTILSLGTSHAEG